MNALIEGVRSRNWSTDDFAILDAPNHIGIINYTFSSSLGISPITMRGRTSGATYILNAEVEVKTKAPFHYVSIDNPEKEVKAQKNDPKQPPIDNAKNSQKLWLGHDFAAKEREIITLLASSGKIPINSEYKELVPEINDKLRPLGFFITASDSEFILKKFDKKSYS